MYKCYYNFSILTTLPFPPVITLTADTIAAVVWFVMPAAGVDVAVCLCGVTCFLTIISSGAYLFTSTIRPFPRLITISRIAKQLSFLQSLAKVQFLCFPYSLIDGKACGWCGWHNPSQVKNPATKLEKCLKLTYGFFIKNMKRVRTFRIFASLKTICN